MTQKVQMPFGLWDSPITPKMVGDTRLFSDIQWDSDGQTLVWIEGCSGESKLYAKSTDGIPHDLTVDQNIRAGVGYGGGDFGISKGIIFFVDISGKIFRQKLGRDIPRPITPQFGSASTPSLSPDGKSLLYVFSDGNEDLLAITDAEGNSWPKQLVKGSDFYMQPVWNPSGDRIAWVEWDHPNMPWDHTRVLMAKLDEQNNIQDIFTIADFEDLPSVEPQFSPDGKWLSYITTKGEWESLILVNLENGEQHTVLEGDGYQLTNNAWGQGRHSYGWTGSSRSIFYLRHFGGFSTLWKLSINTGESELINTDPYATIAQLSVNPVKDEVAFIASGPTVPTRIVHWDGSKLNTVAYSCPEQIADEYIALHQELSWKAPDGMQVYSNYYAPTNPNFTASGLPPVIVFAHGGPTGIIPIRYNQMRNFFTTRGYGFLELNYRGSDGYGLSYQRVMRNQWGKVDTEDARDCIKALHDNKLGDKNRMIIMGGSAGGYLVLNALVQYPGLYSAGIDMFGVSNLFNLALDTHKFESRYLDSMVGPLPEAADRYKAWSPIFHADKIRDPLAVFQGSIDPVVPPDQSEAIVQVLQRNNIPHIYKVYEGEGHGFKKSEHQVNMLEEIVKFLKQHVLFSV